jgi:DeoR/GlpR family transcriptional regulator of sugar metabolism
LGPHANNSLKDVSANKAFLGVAGITDEGLYNSNALVIETERLMMEASAEVYIVTDPTKLGRRALAFLSDFNGITAIITTEAGRDNPLVSQLQEQGVRFMFAPVNARAR